MAKKKTSQSHFDGMEPVTIQEIEDAASEYVDARNERMENLREEIRCKSILGEVMKQHTQTRYVCRNMAQIVEITPGESKLKVVKMAADIDAAAVDVDVDETEDEEKD